MALNPDEMRRKRMERARQRKVQQAMRRKLIVRLLIAAAILTLVAVFIFMIDKPLAPVLPSSATEASTPPETVPETQPETSAGTVPEEKFTTVHLALAGDLNVTDQVVSTDFSQAFLDVTPLLADADITALNFEGNLCGSPYGSASKSAPQEMMEAISRSGVDLVQLANSYSIFNGTSGLASTINAIYAANMEPLGAYRDKADFNAHKGYTIREVEDIKIAFVAFTKGMDGMALPAGSEDCVNVLYTDYDSTYQKVDVEGITGILSEVQKEKPDIVVAMLHWGSEFNDTISKSQKKIVDVLQENGVDAIIGTHSHYVQKMEFDRATGQFVAYSLGDFFGDASRAGSEYSVVLDLEIVKDNETGDAKIAGFTYTPIFTVAESGKPLRVVRITEAMKAYEESYIEKVSQESYDKMKYALERIDARIKGE